KRSTTPSPARVCKSGELAITALTLALSRAAASSEIVAPMEMPNISTRWLRSVGHPPHDRLQVLNLLRQRHASCILCRAVAAPALFPVADKLVALEIQTPLEFRDLV